MDEVLKNLQYFQKHNQILDFRQQSKDKRKLKKELK